MNMFLLALCAGAIFMAINFNKDNYKTVLILSFLVTLLVWGLNYFFLPVMAIWGYDDIWTEITIMVICSTACYFIFFISPDRDIKKQDCFRLMPIAILLIIGIVRIVTSIPMFNASDYQKRLKVTTVNEHKFDQQVSILPLEKMISVDAGLARKVAEDKLGTIPGLGSKCMVGNMTIQSLTGEWVIDNGTKVSFDDDLLWVAPLEHTSFMKYLLHGVTDGYVMVSATDAKQIWLVTEVNGKPLSMRFIESACFSNDIERYVRFNGYGNIGLSDMTMELDKGGNPFWTITTYEPTIGFDGCEATGIITVNIQNGDIKKYDIDNVPAWIDRIQPKDFIVSQIDDWGQYKKGWINSFMAQEGVQISTEGTSLVYSNGKSYWYTGIQSAGADVATSGFMLVDTRTKEAFLYSVSGINETEAMKIAQDQPFAKAAGYKADFPVLYNIAGKPTYFMTMKGASGNVVGYSFVAVNMRQAVGTGASKKEAEQQYLTMLRKFSNDTLREVKTNDLKDYVIKDIVLENTVYYILFEGVKGVEFTGTTEFFRELKWTKPGDKVKVGYMDSNEAIKSLDYFENLDFEI